MTLFWSLDGGEWPQGLSISVRPTQGGAFMPSPDDPAAIIQQDAPRPAQEMLIIALGTESGAASSPVADVYRFEGAQAADGITVIVYRPTDEGFENVAEIRTPIGSSKW